MIAVIILTYNRRAECSNLLYFFPFAILILIALSVFLFWLSYYFFLHKKVSLFALKRTSEVVIIMGYICSFLMVLQISLYFMAHLFHIASFQFKVDSIYYIVSFWAFLELVHHFFYKIMFGERDSFIELIKSTKKWKFKIPFGGAIGIRIKKIFSR